MSDRQPHGSLWLVGAGPMACEYAKVLLAEGHDFEIIGRSEASAAICETLTGIPVRRGGILSALSESGPPSMAVVAVGVDQLAAVATALVTAGTGRVLVEKPAGVNSREIRALWRVAEQSSAEVFVGYNRRFYASVVTARRLIEEDGGATSCVFEITENSENIAELDLPDAVRASWLLANTSHVIDLVFHLCGDPVELSTRAAGSLPWHPRSARFVGSGLTDRGVVFSFHGDWESPGRWGVEVCTRQRRLVLRPLEQLRMAVRGSEAIEEVDIDNQLDLEFKPGLYGLARAFIEGEDRLLCHIREQVERCGIYDKIAGYEDPLS